MIRYTTDIKYSIYLDFKVEGEVEVSDLIGAFIMQSGNKGGKYSFTKLQNLQKVGKIEILNLKNQQFSKKNFTTGTLFIPCDWDKKNISLFCSFLEQVLKKVKIYDCKVMLQKIEPVEKTSSSKIIKRAVEIYHSFFDNTQDTEIDTLDQNFENILNSRNASTLGSFVIGPNFMDHKNILLVEGRADVINLSKKGIGNTLGLNGINFKGEELIEVLKDKIITLFTDGDGGGLAIKKKVSSFIDCSYHIQTPPNKKVEELNKEELYELIRQRTPFDTNML